MYSVIRLSELWSRIRDVISFVLCAFYSLPLCLQVRASDAQGILTMFLIHRLCPSIYLLFLTLTRHFCLPFPTFLPGSWKNLPYLVYLLNIQLYFILFLLLTWFAPDSNIYQIFFIQPFKHYKIFVSLILYFFILFIFCFFLIPDVAGS